MAAGTAGTVDVALLWVMGLSLAAGVLMPVVFGYVSDQRSIRLEKDRIKAHLLAVRLYPGQLSVVLRSYAQTMWGTLRYLRLILKPMVYLALPLTLLIAREDLHLGLRPFAPSEPFLFTVHTATTQQVNELRLIAPPEVAITAPAVHSPGDREVTWRLNATREGNYALTAELKGKRYEKAVVISEKMRRVSPQRLRGNWWARLFLSGESALPKESGIESMELRYPEREIPFLWWHWNWIWLFVALSLLIGLVAKTVFGIEV